MDFFLKYRTIILSSIGALLLVFGMLTYFLYTPPKEEMGENDKAAERIARMEAQAKGSSSAKAPSHSVQRGTSTFTLGMREMQNQQMKYLLILLALLGIGFLIYRFTKKKE